MKPGKKYAAEPARADVLDYLDDPLNDSDWLTGKIESLLTVEDDVVCQDAIREIVAWEDPGPGGYYDDLGNPGKEPHLVRRLRWEEDPGGLGSAIQELDFQLLQRQKLSCRRQASALWGLSLEMHYEGLDPSAKYCLRVSYGGYRQKTSFRLDTGEGIEIHPEMAIPPRCSQFEFPLTREVTRSGSLDLVWSLVGGGRGIAVAEVWLVKTP
jgi:hypothetical protein